MSRLSILSSYRHLGRYRFARFRPLLHMAFVAALSAWLSLSVTPPMALQAQGDAGSAAACAAPDKPGCTAGLPTAEYQRLLQLMSANPAPAVAPITLDEVTRSFALFRATPKAELFDQPNGTVVGAIGDGLTYVKVYERKDGFVRLRDGRWLRRADVVLTGASEFTGVQVKQAPPLPILWVLQTAYTVAYPGGPAKTENPVVKRYQRYNIYATVKVAGFNWYLIGPRQWIEQRKIAKVDFSRLPADAPTAGNWTLVDLYEQTMTAYEGRQPVAVTLVSTGLPPLNTNPGTFKVYQRLALTPLRGSMGDTEYELPNVPFAMFFDREIGFHGVYWHDSFGFRRSHGCVNLSISDAKWLFEWAADRELTVVVWDSAARQ